MKKTILKRFSAQPDKKEREQSMIVSGREMFINQKPRIEIELRKSSKAK